MSRRRAAGLCLGLPLLAMSIREVPAQPLPFGDRLAARLADMSVRIAPSRIELLRFDKEGPRGRCTLTAVVRLHWPPGLRQRAFTAEAVEASAAFAGLDHQIASYIATLHPQMRWHHRPNST